MKAMRTDGIILATLLIVPMAVTGAGQPTLEVVCEGGPAQGSRAFYAVEEGYRVEPETIELGRLRYEFDVPESGSVRVTYDGEQVSGSVLNTDENFRTVTYVYNGVSYMDTLFLNTQKAFSSEHRDDLFGENLAITWHIGCSVTTGP